MKNRIAVLTTVGLQCESEDAPAGDGRSDLVEAGNAAVAAGLADSLSAWVNLALAERVARQQRRSRDGDEIVTSDPDDLEPLASALGRRVEIVGT